MFRNAERISPIAESGAEEVPGPEYDTQKGDDYTRKKAQSYMKFGKNSTKRIELDKQDSGELYDVMPGY